MTLSIHGGSSDLGSADSGLRPQRGWINKASLRSAVSDRNQNPANWMRTNPGHPLAQRPHTYSVAFGLRRIRHFGPLDAAQELHSPKVQVQRLRGLWISKLGAPF